VIDFSRSNFANFLKTMLGNVPGDVDKREESLINTALGPAAYALEDAYIDLEQMQAGAHVQTAVGADLDACAADMGLSRKNAAAAVRLGAFNASVPLGARFSTNEAGAVSFIVTSVSPSYQLTCETPGAVGNNYTGDLTAITYVDGLTTAQVTDILVPGEDEESDDSLRTRCIDHLNSNPFGGNVASYRESVGAIDGVGGVQIYPTWDGGGTVKLSITGSDGMPASSELISTVQTAVDPTQNSGHGYGLAPIGAQVTVTAPAAVSVNISATVTVANGYTLAQLTEFIQTAIGLYIKTVRDSWAAPITAGGTDYASVIYRARVMTAILSVTGVVNVTNLLLNGADADVQLTETGTAQQLPVLGTVTLS